MTLGIGPDWPDVSSRLGLGGEPTRALAGGFQQYLSGGHHGVDLLPRVPVFWLGIDGAPPLRSVAKLFGSQFYTDETRLKANNPAAKIGRPPIPLNCGRRSWADLRPGSPLTIRLNIHTAPPAVTTPGHLTAGRRASARIPVRQKARGALGGLGGRGFHPVRSHQFGFGPQFATVHSGSGWGSSRFRR